jgi:predicted RNA-binding protein (virulence factor B family)
MNVLDAAQATVKAYAGGAESLAPRLGMSGALLRGKVNPGYDRNHLTLAEADLIMTVTDDHRILHALAHTHGYVLQRCDELEQEKADAQHRVDELVLQLMQATGSFAGTIAEAREDGVITPNEAKDTSKAGMSVQKVVVDLVAAIQNQVRLG